MRFLILNTDYPAFLDWFYSEHPGLEHATYDEQMRVRNDSLFGVADFYSSNLRKLGHEAWDIHANNETMQRAWAREHGLSLPPPAVSEARQRQLLARLRRAAARTPLRVLRPLLARLRGRRSSRSDWFCTVLAAQIRHYQPDVLLNQAMDAIPSDFLAEMKPHLRLLVGQIAAPLQATDSFHGYDLVISSLPNFVDFFRRIGIPSELHRFAFEPRVLDRLPQQAPDIPVSFVGSLSSAHRQRVLLLEYLAASPLPLAIWGSGIEALPYDSPIRCRYRYTAWGIEMYRILHRSRVTLNHHIGIAASYANNMRLFEATGIGTLLITDWKQNLAELFEPGREVVAYRDPEECLDLIRYYLHHEAERQAIARAGQRRTLREHTYYRRMQEFLDLVGQHV